MPAPAFDGGTGVHILFSSAVMKILLTFRPKDDM